MTARGMTVTLRGRSASGVPVLPSPGTYCGVTCAAAPELSKMDGDAAAACCAAPCGVVDDGVVDGRVVDGRRTPPDSFAGGPFFCATFASGLETTMCGRLVGVPCSCGAPPAGGAAA